MLDLFFTFAKIGLLMFGGGYSMLPMLTRVIAEQKKWADAEELADWYAVGQITPGIIAVNTATFVGIKRRGVLGGIIATLGVIFPSLVIITLIAAFAQNYAEYEIVKNAFSGIRIAVCALTVNAVYSLAKKSAVDLPAVLLFATAFAAIALAGISPVIVTLAAAAAGIAIKTISAKFLKR